MRIVMEQVQVHEHVVQEAATRETGLLKSERRCPGWAIVLLPTLHDREGQRSMSVVAHVRPASPIDVGACRRRKPNAERISRGAHWELHVFAARRRDAAVCRVGVVVIAVSRRARKAYASRAFVADGARIAVAAGVGPRTV